MGGGQEQGLHEGRLGFLMGELEERIILDNMDYPGKPQRSYPECFVSLSLLLAEI